MRTFLKAIGIIFGILVLVIGSAAILIPLLVDANDYKTHLINLVKEKTGRKLEIGGDIKFSVFPWLGLQVDQVGLGNPQGFDEETPFARAASAALHVKLMPLIEKRIEVDTVGLDGLELNLIKSQDGRTNWDDLARRGKKGEAATSPEKAAAMGLGALTIGGVEMSNGRITIDDQTQGQRMVFDHIRIKSGAIRSGEPIDLRMGFDLEAQSPAAKGTFDLKGKVKFDQSTQRLTVDGMLVTLHAEGPALAGNTIDASIGTQLKLSATGKPSLATLSGTAEQLQVKIGLQRDDLKGEATLGGILRIEGEKNLFSGEQLKIAIEASGAALGDKPLQAEMAAELKVGLDGDAVEVNSLHLIAEPVRMSGALRAQGLKANPQVAGNLKLTEFSPRDLLAALNLEAPVTADPETLKHFGGEFNLAASRGGEKDHPFTLTLKPLNLQLDDTKVEGALSLAGSSYRFDLNLDRLDLDRYLPPPAEPSEASNEATEPTGSGLVIENASTDSADAPETAESKAKEETAEGEPPPAEEPAIPLPLELLKAMEINGTLNIGELQVRKLKMGNIQLRLQSKDGVTRLENRVGSLYEGKLEGSFSVDSRNLPPAVHLRQAMADTQIGPMLDALKGEGRLVGKGKINLDLQSQGIGVQQIKRELNGKIDFRFEDGAIRGINMAQAIREGEARFKGEPIPATDSPMQTDFTELSGSALVSRGVLANHDLLMKSPYLRVTGSGDLDLPAETVDYTVTTTLVASEEGQVGKEPADLGGIPTPVRIAGPFDHPRYTADWEKLLVEAEKNGLQETPEEAVIEKQGDTAKDQPELQGAPNGSPKQ